MIKYAINNFNGKIDRKDLNEKIVFHSIFHERERAKYSDNNTYYNIIVSITYQ